jgi:hypothetical protein
MTEKDLIERGFTKVEVPKIESGDTTDYYYYTYMFSNDWTIISCASDEVVDNNWSVSIDEIAEVCVSDIEELKVFINLVEKWLRSQKCG